MRDMSFNEKLSAKSVNDTNNPVDGSAHEAPATESISPTKTVLLTIGLCMAVFCMCLDNTIVSTAIPDITNQFHAINDVGW